LSPNAGRATLGRMTYHHCTRRLVAVDLENVAHTAIVDVEWAVDAAYLLSTTMHLDERDLVYVAGGPQNLEAVARVARIMHGQARIRAGVDGADRTLIEVLDETPTSAIESGRTPITEVVVMSGDGIFAPVAQRYATRGLDVVVVSRTDQLSGDLEAVASRVVLVDGLIRPDEYALTA